MEISCRLYDFKADDKLHNESDSDSDEKYGKYKFCIQLFGIDNHGKTYCIWVNDFSPFFYIKIPQHWKKSEIGIFVKEIVNKTNINTKDIVGVKPVSKKKLYGFDGNKNHRFVELKFINLLTFQKIL